MLLNGIQNLISLHLELGIQSIQHVIFHVRPQDVG